MSPEVKRLCAHAPVCTSIDTHTYTLLPLPPSTSACPCEKGSLPWSTMPCYNTAVACTSMLVTGQPIPCMFAKYISQWPELPKDAFLRTHPLSLSKARPHLERQAGLAQTRLSSDPHPRPQGKHKLRNWQGREHRAGGFACSRGCREGLWFMMGLGSCAMIFECDAPSTEVMIVFFWDLNENNMK